MSFALSAWFYIKVCLGIPGSGVPPCAMQSETNIHSPWIPLLTVQALPVDRIGCCPPTTVLPVAVAEDIAVKAAKIWMIECILVYINKNILIGETWGDIRGQHTKSWRERHK